MSYLYYFTDTTSTMSFNVKRNESICLPLPNSTALCSFTNTTTLGLAIGPACFIHIRSLSATVKVDGYNCYKNLKNKFNVTYDNELKMACLSDWDDGMTEITVLYACRNSYDNNWLCAYSYNIMIGEY